MKRALVSCASFAILAVSACSSDSHPVITPVLPTIDAGLLEIGRTWPSDARGTTGDATTGGSKDAAKDASLAGDAPTTGIDGPPASKVTVVIVDPAPVADGGEASLPVFASTGRLAPNVRVEVQSLGGDSTSDVVMNVVAVLTAEGSTTVASKVSLNQTQYQAIPASNTKMYLYGNTALETVALATGKYDIAVTAVTAGGATATATSSVFIDGGPTITFLQPADGLFVKGSLVATVVVIDERVGVKDVEFAVGQTEIPASAIVSKDAQYTITLDFGSFNPPLDGLQVLRAAATNNNGVVSKVMRKFTVDNDGPKIEATKPATGDMIGRLITIQAAVSDLGGVREGSVVAVIAHGDVKFEVRLIKQSDGNYKALFDTTQLPIYALFPSISFRAEDTLGNQSSVGYLVSLDNTPPIMELDPFDRIVAFKKTTGTCSWPFDPTGPDAIDDGSVVTQLFDIRARIEDEGNAPLTGYADFVPISAVDPASVKVLILDDVSLPLVVDTTDPPDGTCDDVNPDLVPSVAPQSTRDAQLIDMVSMARAGTPDFSYQPGVACTDNDVPARPFCATTVSLAKGQAMTFAMGYGANLPSIWTIPPVVGDGLQCAGRQFDASNNLQDGWACVVVMASDNLGNKQVSPPIRICVAAKPDSKACTPSQGGPTEIVGISLPSSDTGQVVITTGAALANVGGGPITAGQKLNIKNVAPAWAAFLDGSHAVTPVAGSSTQFVLDGVTSALYDLWLFTGTDKQNKGPVGIVVSAGENIRIVTDNPAAALPAGFKGSVIVVPHGVDPGQSYDLWAPTNIDATGFNLADSVTRTSGMVVPAASMPDCTGTVIKGTNGAASKVDGTKPCKPWRLFPPGESIVY